MNRRLILSIILVIICALCIFGFSNKNSTDSNSASKLIVSKAVKQYYKIVSKPITDNELKVIVNKLNKPFRKLCHMSEYFIFCLLIILLLSNFNIEYNKIYLITILLCFVFACFDEYHQTFIDGRTGQFIDTLIDTFGSIIGCLFIFIIRKIKKNSVNALV